MMLSVPGCLSDHIQYLLKVDVLIDDSLVPLGVETLARMFGPPLVFGTGGNTSQHRSQTRKESRRPMGHHNPESTIYWSGAQCDSRGDRMNVMYILRTVTMYGPTWMDGSVRCQGVLQKSPF